MTHLKPCPFCGGKAAAVTVAFTETVMVQCQVCQCRTRGRAITDSAAQTTAQAVASWNRRTPDTRAYCASCGEPYPCGCTGAGTAG